MFTNALDRRVYCVKEFATEAGPLLIVPTNRFD